MASSSSTDQTPLRSSSSTAITAEAGDDEKRRPVFGERYLTDPNNVFQHNAWDHVEWDCEHKKQAEELVLKNSSQKLTEQEQVELISAASASWDSFYTQHQNKFFKDRHWLFTEFPELLGNKDTPISVLEVGCGTGNTVFPILQTARPGGVFVSCCDFSSTAVELVKKNSLYDSIHCSAFVHDISSDEPIPIKPESIDYVVLIFVLSAIHPDRFLHVLKKVKDCLRPGGKILFRDYGRLDLAQLRFKPGQCLAENFYVRGDRTLVYYFTEDEVGELLGRVGLLKEQLLTDKRLQVNRGKQIKMYRVWVQAKFVKP